MPSLIFETAEKYGPKNLLVRWNTDGGVWLGQGATARGNYTIEVQGFYEYVARTTVLGLIDPESKDVNVRLNSAEFDGLIEMNVLTADFDQLWKNKAVDVFAISLDVTGEKPYYTKLAGPAPF